MITDEHFEALRKMREEAESLRLTCIAKAPAGSLLHLAYDRDVRLRPSKPQEDLLGKLRSVR